MLIFGAEGGSRLGTRPDKMQIVEKPFLTLHITVLAGYMLLWVFLLGDFIRAFGTKRHTILPLDL